MSALPAEELAQFTRQRRFLILMSLALAAFYILGVQVKSDAEQSGFAVKIGHPKYVEYAVWVVWSYALVRYWQILYNSRNVLLPLLRQVRREEDLRLAFAIAKQIGNTMAQRDEVAQVPPTARIEGDVQPSSEMHTTQATSGDTVSVNMASVDFLRLKSGGRRYFLIANFRWPDGGLRQGFVANLSRAQTFRVRVGAMFGTLVLRPQFSEFVGPVLIALVAAVIGVWFLLTGDTTPTINGPLWD